MSKTYEMMWDCGYCDTKKLLGKSHKHCPSCGTAQDPNKRYFPPEEEKVAVEDHQFVGADKVCPYCDAPNSAIATYCTECAGPLDGSKEVNLVDEKPTPPSKPAAEPKSSKLPWIIGIILIVVIAVIALLQMTEERSVTVVGHSWERNIEIEQYKLVTENDWRDKVPSKGSIRTCTDKERSTEKVADGETCTTVKNDNGDGTYKESEKCQTKYKEVPIYDDWCSYDIKKWTVVDTKKAAGKTLEPSWPTTAIRECSMIALGCEREGSKTSKYNVHFKDEAGKEHACAFTESKWKEIAVNQTKVMEFGQVTGNIDCDSWDKK